MTQRAERTVAVHEPGLVGARADDPVVVLRQVQQSTARFHAGPLPSPEDLDAYEAVHPGLAERIVLMAERQVGMAEQQMTHRHEMERTVVQGHERRAGTGLWCGVALSVTVLGAAVWLVLAGHDAAGTTLAAVDVTGLAAVFVYGRYEQSRRETDGP